MDTVTGPNTAFTVLFNLRINPYYGQFLRCPQVHYREVPLYI